GRQFFGEMPALGADLRARRVRVHQDREAATGGPVDRPLRARRHPHRRVGQLCRLWQYLDIVEAEMRASKTESFLGPGLEDDLDGLAEARGTLLGGHAEGGEFDPRKAASGAPIDPPAG